MCNFKYYYIETCFFGCKLKKKITVYIFYYCVIFLIIVFFDRVEKDATNWSRDKFKELFVGMRIEDEKGKQ